MDNIPLSDIYQVKGRFYRSVHLERDFYTTEDVLNGYILTVTAREMISRVISTFENGTTSKAWSITGPYGSGKSAFALFAAKLLGDSNASTTQQALNLLQCGDVSLYERFTRTHGNGQPLSDFCPVLISGECASLSIALLRGLEQGLKTFGIPSASAPRPNIRKLLKTAANHIPLQASEITNLFESATRAIKRKGGQGLLLVIDELGKFLEYAAQSPAQGDVFVLQTLAEFATRSEQTPLLFLTILHQAFEQYANKFAKSQQEEWAKVQGRFEDIAFVEPTEQVLRLIGSAIERASEGKEENLSLPNDFDLKPNQLTESEFSELLKNCLPLHPIVALVIDSIFRRFAQNERSLFAFLSSNEPYGLQNFLSTQHRNGTFSPLFSIANLYDYLKTNMGSRLYASRHGKKWAEIESALDRLPDPSSMQIQLIKTIGVLNIVGEVIPNLKASEQLLRYTLDDNTERFTSEFETVLATLKERSIVIYRLYNKTYALWEGSDIDIETKLREAERHIDTQGTLAADLACYLPTRPLVARRHLFETGTLRYFAVRYTDLENFDADLEESLEDADGLVLYALPTNEHEIKHLSEKASRTKLTEREEVLIAIPRAIGTLRDTVTQLTSLRWVSENTPELEGDAVARDELSVQQIQAEQEVSHKLTTIFGGAKKDTCTWYYKGQFVDTINSQGTRNAYLSEICDEVYRKTPIIRNELINRRKISGTVTTARKKLIQAMLENGDQENLGIVGYPAEMSIYRSLLLGTSIHREDSGMWGFHRPKQSDKNQISHTWEAIEDFLETCEGERQPVVKLYQYLMAPPLGVREGLLPILLCAVMLRYKTEVALYQDGSFIPNWSVPVFERFLKVPEKFEIKRFRMIAARAELLRQYLNALNQPIETEVPDLLTVIKSLMPFISRLPKYTLNTDTLSDNAKNLRTAVLNAREPDELIFTELPEALGFSAFRVETTNSNAATRFSNTLQNTLSELGRAYENLLHSIEKQMKAAFVLTGDRDNFRKTLVHKAEPLREIASEPQLQQFLIRICDEQLDFSNWIEAIGATLAGKPPKSWFDRDTDIFQSNFSEVVRKFRHFEAVSYEKLKYTESSAGEPIRIGITGPNQDEQERVVTLTPTAGEQTLEIEGAIKQVFQDLNVDDNPELHIAILAKISQHWIQQLDE
ncbi:hypothetical protein C6496_22785 [Candidatus Poribacteria bacterium]|nr:MAG: hypothetical protein C6496_22785 [Candidatus Poribacteria bacterium]